MRTNEQISEQWSIIALLLSLVSMIMSAVVPHMLNKNAQQVATEKLRVEAEILQKQFKKDLKWALLNEVKEARGSDSAHILTTISLVFAHLKDSVDLEFKNTLISDLQLNSKFDFSKVIQNLEGYYADELEYTKPNTARPNTDANSLDNSHSNPKQYTIIDVFYLEDLKQESEPRARAIFERLREEYPNYTIRQRILPKSVNARPGYLIDFNQVRYDKKSSNEKRIAEEICERINTTTILEKEKLKAIPISSSTEGYISVFIRNM